MACLFRVNKKCYTVMWFRKGCGAACHAVCSYRGKYERSMKRLCDEIENRRMESERLLGIGACR